MRVTLALIKIVAITAWTFILLPAQLIGITLYRPLAVNVPVLYHRGVCALLGLEVEVWGARAPRAPVLFVANHSSWLDISVLSTVIPGSFIAKQEVAGWPAFGLLAKLQRSVFIERVPRRAADQRDEITERLEAGDNLILFPEGTSSDGNRVLPFKSALFAVAERPVKGRALTLQPVSVAYTRLDFMPLGRHLRPLFTWYGDMELGPHIWGVLGLGPATATVVLHAPVTLESYPSRKALAEYCQARVEEGLSQALAGRLPDGVGLRPGPELDSFSHGAPETAATPQNP